MTAPRKDRKPRPWSRPLADLVKPLVDPALAKRGFGQSDIVLYWEEIVGERLAQASSPLKLQWPPKKAGESGFTPATLLLRVETGFALELQHLSGVVVDRVNAHLGWRCVDRLVLKQGPVGKRRERPAPRAPDPRIVNDVEAGLANIGDDALRKALTRLGANVLTRSQARRD